MTDAVKDRARALTLRLAGVLAFVGAVYVPRALWPRAPLFADRLAFDLLGLVGSALKLGALGGGAFLAGRSARALGPGNPASRPWWMLSAFLACFATGQLVLSGYEAAHHPPPLPSVGDAFFLAGYAMMLAGTIQFVRVYRATGFPLGHPLEHPILAAVLTALFAAIGVPLLGPLLAGDHPLGERLISAAYPALDFVALVPTILLVRIGWHFRGGRVWTIWATLTAGLVFAFAGDLAFAFWATSGASWGAGLGRLVDPLLISSYVLLAFGAARQDALVRGTEEDA